MNAAIAVQKKAYAPYSTFHVGAAIELENGHIYSGCNVENVSNGATVCAERGAIQTAIANEGVCKVKRIVVCNDANPPCAPCGLCRQVIGEFAADDLEIISVNPKTKETVHFKFSELFPSGFSNLTANLKK